MRAGENRRVGKHVVVRRDEVVSIVSGRAIQRRRCRLPVRGKIEPDVGGAIQTVRERHVRRGPDHHERRIRHAGREIGSSARGDRVRHRHRPRPCVLTAHRLGDARVTPSVVPSEAFALMVVTRSP